MGDDDDEASPSHGPDCFGDREAATVVPACWKVLVAYAFLVYTLVGSTALDWQLYSAERAACTVLEHTVVNATGCTWFAGACYAPEWGVLMRADDATVLTRARRRKVYQRKDEALRAAGATAVGSTHTCVYKSVDGRVWFGDDVPSNFYDVLKATIVTIIFTVIFFACVACAFAGLAAVVSEVYDTCRRPQARRSAAKACV